MTATTLGDALQREVPPATVHPAAETDAIAGVQPRAVVRPDEVEQVATLLRLAAAHGWAVAPRGGGTLLDLGNPPERLDIVLDMTALDRVLDYQPDDMTVTAQAGATLASVRRVLAERNQVLPLDAPLPERATVGGTLAANISGPRRLRFGTARDVVIGMQFATPRGGLARSGGKVVKNVAGYDLSKLHVGGLGTAGVITEATFKLQPAPAEQAAQYAEFASFEHALSAARTLLRSQLFPAALELWNQPPSGPHSASWSLIVLFQGVRPAVSRACAETESLCSAAGMTGVAWEDGEAARGRVDSYRDIGRTSGLQAALITRASTLPSEVERVIRPLLAEANRTTRIVVQPAAGSVRALWESIAPDRVAPLVQSLRAQWMSFGGTLTIERAPHGSLAGVDVWGLEGGDLALMRRLKEVYDPDCVLNPGRFVAGI